MNTDNHGFLKPFNSVKQLQASQSCYSPALQWRPFLPPPLTHDSMRRRGLDWMDVANVDMGNPGLQEITHRQALALGTRLGYITCRTSHSSLGFFRIISSLQLLDTSS